MFKVPKQEFTAEFKELAVNWVRSGQGVAVVARDLGLVEQTLRNWVKAAKAGKLGGGMAVGERPQDLPRPRP